MENLIYLILGVMIVIIGAVNMTGNISTIHWYNRRKVKDEDVPKYGKAVGIGTLIIGAALVVDYIFILFDVQITVVAVTIPAIIAGLAFILYAQFKYNKGIF